MNKTAKEMFEELGYECICDDTRYLIYSMFNFENGITTETMIDKYYKSYKVSNYTRNNKIFSSLINLELHKAITQQMKELDWIE